MTRIWTLARREWRDQWRQPWMLGAMVLVPVLTGLAVLGLLVLLDYLQEDPERSALFASNLKWIGLGLDETLGSAGTTAVAVWNFLLLSQLMGMTAVLAGHAILHDRECGALPFLVLAPVRPGELVAGKVLGAIGAPVVLTLVAAVPLGTAMALLPGVDLSSPMLPLHPSWWAAVLGGGGSWAAVVAALAIPLSGLARDVRTAQQGAWLLVFVVNLGVCGALLAAMSAGWGIGLALTAVGLAVLMPTMFLGGRILQGAV